MDPREQLAHILPAITEIVSGIEPHQLTSATPCDRFDVHDVLNHMITGGGTFASAFRGEEPAEVLAPDTAGQVPVAEFRKAMEDLLEAMNSSGAMERTIDSPVGVMPGESFARLVAFDGLVHGWDLASATGATYQLPSAVVAEVDEFARAALTPAMRDGDTFKDATEPPANASAIDRVAAFSGRSV